MNRRLSLLGPSNSAYGLEQANLALDGVYHLDSGCIPKQPYSEKKRKIKKPGQHQFFSVFPQRKYKKKGCFLHC
jgi:hypothetical protein